MIDFEYMVCVQCMTYNHSKYITDALNGFAMQKTNFPFVCLVMDDASTDGEQEVIKDFLNRECLMDKAEYYDYELADIVIVGHKTNQNCTFAVYFLKENLYNTDKKRPLVEEWSSHCKYEALCEGDDYWIDPLKLQKQVEYMDTNSGCSLCCTDAVILTAKTTLSWTRYHKSRIIPIKDLIIGGGLWVQTASFIFKKGLLINWPKYCNECHVGDYPHILWAALNGYVYYLNDKTDIYRYQSNGSWTARQGKMGTSKKVPGWISELRMLDGLNEYSSYRFSNYFKKRQTRYMFAIFSNYRYNPHQFTLDFSNHLDDLPFIFRYYVKVSLNHNYSCIYLRIIKRICTLFYA